MTTNSFGGSDLHQDLLDQYILSMAHDMAATEQGLQSPRTEALLTAISTIVLPYADARINALAEGKDGISDGKVWFVRQDVLVEKIQKSKGFLEPSAWFEETLKQILSIAQEGAGHNVQAISSSVMVELLSEVMQPGSGWQEKMGYDDAHFQQKPALNALKIWRSMGPAGFQSQKRVLGTGTYNEHAQDIIAALWTPGIPEVIANPESKEPYKAFLSSFVDLAKKNELHSIALQSIGLLGIAQRYLGVLSSAHKDHFQTILENLTCISYEENISLSTQERARLIQMWGSPQDFSSGRTFKSPLVHEAPKTRFKALKF